MLIVLEGPDGGGKTSLADALDHRWRGSAAGTRRLVTHRVKTGPPTSLDVCPFTEYETALDAEPLGAYLRSDRALVLGDRWHAGEMVYGPLLRGHSRLTPAGMLHVELTLTGAGAVKVMCLPPLTEVQRWFATRGDDLVNARHLPALWAWYQAHAQLFGYQVVTGTEPTPALLDELIYLAEVNAAAADLVRSSAAGTYVGRLRPRALLCGDVRNAGPRARLDLTRPFTPTNANGSSEWLLDAVLTANLPGEVGLVNTGEPGVDLSTLWEVLGRPRLVALGGNADRRLTDLDLKHVKIPHPQWAKRFATKDFGGYVQQLEEAVRGDR